VCVLVCDRLWSLDLISMDFMVPPGSPFQWSTPLGKNASLLSNVGFGGFIRRGSHPWQSFMEQGGK
jgi:hypothetical protein